MRTSDFTSKPSSKVMNETLNKKFGEKLDIDNYSPAQLEKAASLIESRIAVLKKGKFNETLNSEEFHRLKLMQDIVKTAITERAVSKAQQQAAGAALAAKRDKGTAKGASKEMSKMSTKELKKFAGTKHKGLPKHKKTDESIYEGVALDKLAKIYGGPLPPNLLDRIKNMADKSELNNLAYLIGDGRPVSGEFELLQQAKAELSSHGAMAEGKKVNKAPKEGTAFTGALAKARADGVQPGEKMKVGGKTYPVKEAAKPDFLDLDGDKNKKEPMKQAAKDKKVDEVSNAMKQRAVDSALAKSADSKKAGWNKKGDEKKGKKADAARDTFRKKTDQAGRIVMKMKESVMQESVMKSISRLLREGEESKAELIMAVKDMVDKFTGWSEDIAQMQAQTAMEMADAIRDELGADQAEAFTASVQPALDAAFQSVKGAREALNGSVASLTGVAPTPMGAEPGMDPGMDMEPGMDAELDAEMPTDDAEMDMDVDTAAPVDRAKRESIEHRLRLTKLLVGR